MPVTQDMIDAFRDRLAEKKKNHKAGINERHELWDAVLRTYYPDYSFAALAEELGCDPSTLQKRWAKIKREGGNERSR